MGGKKKKRVMFGPGTQGFWVLPQLFYRLSAKNATNLSRCDSSVLTLMSEE